jgi:hypothetical protein
MKVEVTGYAPVRFTDDATGELIEGTNVYYLHDDVQTRGRVATKKFFKSGMNIPELVPGGIYEMEFGPKGRLNNKAKGARVKLRPKSKSKCISRL